jgi:outer membrane protein TolC
VAAQPAAEDPETPEKAGFTLQSLRASGGMTADEAARRATEVAPELDKARRAAESAEASAAKAMVGFFPRVEVEGRYSRVNEIDQEPIVPPQTDEERQRQQMLVQGVDDPDAQTLWQGTLSQQQALSDFRVPIFQNQFALSGTVSYPVTDLFLTILPSYRAADDVAEARELQAEAKQSQIALRGREVFYAYVRARGSLEVAQAALEQAKVNERNTKALVRAGAAPGVDLRRMEARLASARVRVARARSRVAETKHQVRVFLDLPQDERIGMGEDLTGTPPPIKEDRQALLRRALEQRAEIQALRRLTDARDSQSRAQAGRRWPNLVLQAGIEYSNPNPRVFPPVDEFRTSWDVNVLLRWSPNDLAKHHFSYRAADAEAGQAQADLAALEDAIRQEVVQAYEGRVAADRAREAAEAGVEAAEESYRARVVQLRAGRAVTSDLIEADADLSRARLQLLDAAINQRLAWARLKHAIGDAP